MNPLTWLFDASIHFPHVSFLGIDFDETDILWREIIGNVFGIGSAVLGMYRKVWTWPIGMIGNVLLFTVFMGAIFDVPQGHANLWGQASRQVFFVVVSIYGWWRWNQSRRSSQGGGGHAVSPRWATSRERLALLAFAVVGITACYFIFQELGSYGPFTESWIFIGSLLATYGLARGYVEFWLIWIAVDAVGVPSLLRANYYPSALLYLVYAGFVIWGFVTWMRVRQRIDADAAPPAEAAAATVVA